VVSYWADDIDFELRLYAHSMDYLRTILVGNIIFIPRMVRYGNDTVLAVCSSIGLETREKCRYVRYHILPSSTIWVHVGNNAYEVVANYRDETPIEHCAWGRI